MKGRGDRQAGFSIIEAVVVVAVIGVLGAAGWFVYQHNRAKVTSAAAGTQTTNQGTQQSTTPPTQTAATLDIKEWGVHMTLDSTTASLYYYIYPNFPDGAYLSLRTIAAVAPGCAADKGGLGAIGRLTEAEQQAIVSGSTPGVAGSIHIGSYWYSFQNSHAACTDGSAAMNAAVSNAAPGFSLVTLKNAFNTLAAD